MPSLSQSSFGKVWTSEFSSSSCSSMSSKIPAAAGLSWAECHMHCPSNQKNTQLSHKSVNTTTGLNFGFRELASSKITIAWYESSWTGAFLTLSNTRMPEVYMWLRTAFREHNSMSVVPLKLYPKVCIDTCVSKFLCPCTSTHCHWRLSTFMFCKM